MEQKFLLETSMAENNYGFDFSFPAEQSQMLYDNKGACNELGKDMKRRDILSLRFYKDKNTSHACVQVESKTSPRTSYN